MSFVDLCRQFIAMDTSPQAGTREAALWLREVAQSFQLQVDLQEETFNDCDQANLFIRTGSNQADELLLQAHFDTLNPGSHSIWNDNLLNPFHATIKNGKLYGLGACEPKIDLLCKLEALKTFVGQTNWKIAPVVAATSGGEIGMQGMLRAIRKNKFSARYALVGEPSSHKMIYAGMGYAVIEFYIPYSSDERQYRLEHDQQESVSTQSKFFRGQSNRSSEGESSENALNKAFEYLIQLPESVVLMDIEGGTNHNTVANTAVLELDLYGGVQEPMVRKLKQLYLVLQEIGSEFLIHQDRDFMPSHPTMNMGLIKSHDDHVNLTMGFRFPPIVQEAHYQNWLEKLKRGTTLVGGECRVADYKRPYRTNLNSDFVKSCDQALSSMNMPQEYVTQATCTEMSLLNRKGIICLGIGAGDRKSSPNLSGAFVEVSDLERSVELYRRIIERVCL